MDFEELSVLVPCHSLEDFPDHLHGAQAESLLGGWSALWHPRLLASAGRIPTWFRADYPPAPEAKRLMIVPLPSEAHLPADWGNEPAEDRASVLRGLNSRDDIVAAALALLPGCTSPLAQELSPDFLSLGLCHLLVELLTRYARYTTYVDDHRLEECAVAAARAAQQDDRDEARRQLKGAFDVLLEARERFYPVEAYLIDVTLLTETTLGHRLAQSLASGTKTNYLAAGKLVEQLASEHPATLAALREALESGTAAVIGGEYEEDELPLMPLEHVLENFRRGSQAYEQHLGRRAKVFARRRCGLTPLLPQLLSRLGFDGALHVSFDEGKVPPSNRCKIRWEGLDHSAIDALALLPLDASNVESVLRLPRRMGESMDHDHVATVLLAHWPGDECPLYQDLRRAAAYAPVLGSFATLPDYFLRTDRPGELCQFRADDYRWPYLARAVSEGQRDPISRHATRYRRRAWAHAAQTLSSLASLVSRSGADPSAVALNSDTPGDDACDEQLERNLQSAARQFANSVSGNSSSQSRCWLNSQSFPRRIVVDRDHGDSATLVPLRSTGLAPAPMSAEIIELPPLGFAREAAPGPGSRSQPLAENNVLRNEFLQVTVNPETGAIRSIHDYQRRGNRLSQQLAIRLPGPSSEPPRYTSMVAEHVEVACAGPVIGEITARGQLVDDAGRRVAGYAQSVRLSRGSRVALVQMELELADDLGRDPWNSYIASRFAWGDSTSEIYRNLGLAVVRTERSRFEAPLLIDIRSEDCRTSILTCGQPYHVQTSERTLDTLLAVRGETARRFAVGIGIDLEQPLQEALSLLEPAAAVGGQSSGASSGKSGWLFRLDAKNVIGTAWQSLAEDSNIVGFRARFCETKGRPGRVRLSCFRPILRAQQVDFRGQTLAILPVEGDRITIDFGSYEWVELEARFADQIETPAVSSSRTDTA